MTYLAANLEIRRNPALLLSDGQDPRPGGTIISIAFPYYSGDPYRPEKLKISRYALGDDYHEVIRKRLRPVASYITAETGHETRICVDTAPILERHWAVEAGLGFIGRNSQLIIPGQGSHIFLAEIVTRAILPPNKPCTLSCPPDCIRCIRACPALSSNQPQTLSYSFDARLCHSYLTIEHRGEFPAGFHLRPSRIYGCDLCLEICPLSHPTPSYSQTNTSTSCLPEFTPRENLLSLTADNIRSLTPESYAILFRHSPIKRAKLPSLLRNLMHLP